LGALKGSISYSKFYVRGELPDDFRDRFVERVGLRVFRPLVPEEDAGERAGWCSIAHPFDTELDHEKIFFNGYLNLGLRIDRWVIPSALFKAHFEQAAREHLEKRGREKLARREKEELKAMVEKRLRRQLMPAMKVIDLSWNLDTGVVRFWNQSAKVHELLDELFKDTFQLDLVPHGPATAALDMGLSDAEIDLLQRVEPSTYHAVHH